MLEFWVRNTPRPGCPAGCLAGAYAWAMTDATPPGPPQPPVTVTPDPDAQAEGKEGRLGTILMAMAVAGIAVLVLDLVFKGKLLAPLFALLPAPKPHTVAEEPGDGGTPAPEQ